MPRAVDAQGLGGLHAGTMRYQRWFCPRGRVVKPSGLQADKEAPPRRAGTRRPRARRLLSGTGPASRELEYTSCPLLPGVGKGSKG